jgi:magnesium transporter
MIAEYTYQTPTHYRWIDIKDASPDEVVSLRSYINLHQTTLFDINDDKHLPKFETFEGEYQFIICRFYNEQAAKEADSIIQLTHRLVIIFSENVLITLHNHASNVVESIQSRYAEQLPIPELVCKLVKACFQQYDAQIEKLDAEVDFYESRIFLRKRIPDLLKNLYFIKRRITAYRKLFNLSKEILDKLKTVLPKSAVAQDLRDTYIRTDTFIEEVYESINALLNIYISLSSQRTNEVMRVLTVFSAFFLPLTFIVGVYGMNFEWMPELQWRYGYLSIWIIMTVTTILIFRWFRKKSWV